MRGLLAACLSLMALADGAAAADLAVPATTGPASPSYDWSGWYVGGHVGYAGATSDWSATAGGSGGVPAGRLDLYQGFDILSGDGSYFAGFQGGFDVLFPSRWLFGIAADVSFPNTIAATASTTSATAGAATFGETVLHMGAVRGRIGHTFGDWLVYATGGFAWSYDQFTHTQLGGGVLAPGGNETALLWRLGWTAGAGIALPVAPHWTANVEYLFSDFGRRGVTFPALPEMFDSDLVLQEVRIGLDYRFADGAATNGSAVLPVGPVNDIWNVHGQTTFIEQYAAPFRAPYRGPQSLDANAGRETYDATAILGLRLWQGAELWVNPELDQGFGLGNSHGVAGFPSGEAYKVGADYPYARLQRAFMRQVIDLGGASQKVAAGPNQFAGSQTADRLVLTVGKLAVTDIFDVNKYAHDARADFMNWSLIDAGTFDYAADAWGYTLGAAAEWYRGDWTLRGGVFDLSTVPNAVALDSHFGQFQWVGEIERRYTLAGHAGKIAVTGFLSRGRMGTYQDAVALAAIIGGPADIGAVRQYRSRGGVSMNLEQEITADLGAFARAGLANGDIEPYEFTDIDRTVAAGLSLKGTQWGRPDDTFGLAGVVNGISAAHEAFFNDGGLGIVIGDGQLPHPGPEQIVETYYGFPLAFSRLTLDYQFIVNPAYNRDRGPASVVSARLHAQF